MKKQKKLKKQPFIMVDYKTIMREDLTIYDKSVYLVLCAYANKDTAECYPSYQTIANKAGCSKRRAVTAIAHLEELGLIEKQQRVKDSHYTSNLYTICDAPQPSPDAPLAPPQPAPGASCTPPRAGGTPGDAPHAIKPDALNQNELNQTGRLDEIASAKQKIEYDTLTQEMPDMFSVLEFVPGIVCELSAEPFAQDLCADDVRAFLKSRTDCQSRAHLLQLPTMAPAYLRRCIRDSLTARHRPKQPVNGAW